MAKRIMIAGLVIVAAVVAYLATRPSDHRGESLSPARPEASEPARAVDYQPIRGVDLMPPDDERRVSPPDVQETPEARRWRESSEMMSIFLGEPKPSIGGRAIDASGRALPGITLDFDIQA